jgi:cytoskeletal protein RodZ
MSVDNPIHRARIARGISLSEVTARTFLSPRIVQRIDEGAFDQLPGGVYARSYVRTFAALVGLDPEATLHQLSAQLPPAEDPMPVLRHTFAFGESCRQELWTGWVSAAVLGAGAIRGACQHLQARSRRFLTASICIAIPRRLFH